MIIAEIVSQHVEEAAFLWLLRSNAIRQPHYALKDLAKLDDRVEAHLVLRHIWMDCAWPENQGGSCAKPRWGMKKTGKSLPPL